MRNQEPSLGESIAPETKTPLLGGMRPSWWRYKPHTSEVMLGLMDPAQQRGDILCLDLSSGQCVSREVATDLEEGLPSLLSFFQDLVQQHNQAAPA